MTTQNGMGDVATLEGGGPPATPDDLTPAEYRAQLAEYKARLDKMEADNRSEAGRRKPTDELRAEIQTLRGLIEEGNELSTRNLGALVRAWSSNDPAQLEQETDRLEKEGELSRGQRAFLRVQTDIGAQIREALLDDDGNAILSSGAPELARASELWNAGTAAKDPVQLTQALAEVNRAVLRIERRKANGAVEEAEKRGRKEALSEARKLGNADNGSPAIVGGDGKGHFTRAQLDAMTPEEYVKQRASILR